MNTTSIVAIIAVVIIIGGAAYYNVMTPPGEIMMKKGDAMMDKGTDMMQKGDAMAKEGDAMMKDGEKMMGTSTGAMMMHVGTYADYSADKVTNAKGKVVLFFHASWCPICRALDADITAHLKDIPQDVTILKVDYDSETVLKQKYGVTQQYTLVQVDAAGTKINKWIGTTALVDLVAHIK